MLLIGLYFYGQKVISWFICLKTPNNILVVYARAMALVGPIWVYLSLV